MECVFCEIIKGTQKGYRIYENKNALVILDINPLAKGHCLAVSRRHIQWWHDLREDEIADLFKACKIAAEKIKKAYKPDFVMMYARGRRIPHVHIFLVPTSKGDTMDRYFNALEGFQESTTELAEMKSQFDQITADLLKAD